ncbi:MAG: hypothetical protein WD157_00340 [Patescibacteria group bacterium]
MEHEQHQAQPVEAPQDKISSLTDAAKTLNSFGVIVFFVIVIEIILLFGINLYQNARFKSLSNNLTDLRTTLSGPEYQTINDQVESVISGTDRLQVVLATKVKWSNFYQMLNAVTPKDVKLDTINITSDGTFKADGKTKSLTSLAQALVAWNGGVATTPSPFTVIKLNSNGFVSSDGGRQVSFTISGQVDLGSVR